MNLNNFRPHKGVNSKAEYTTKLMTNMSSANVVITLHC